MTLLEAPLAGGPLVDDPYPFYSQLRREAPVWRVPDTTCPVFLVSTWALVAEATGVVDDFSNHFRHSLVRRDDDTVDVIDSGEGGALDVFAGADPPEHTLHRKVFFPELMQKRMETLEDDVTAIVDGLLDEVVASDRVDLAAAVANLLPMRVITEHVIGFRDVDVASVSRWVFAGARFSGGRLRPEEMAEAGGEAAAMLPWVARQLGAAIAEPGDGDVLSATAGAVRDGILTPDAAAFTLMVLLGAGGETTTSLIGNAIRVLAERPALQAELRAGPALVPAFVEEVLRFESPFRFHPRLAVHDTELGGVEIPERSMVALMWGAANRDEAEFDHADDVVLDRPNARAHLGFGRGIHHCVGAPLARLEARIAITRLLDRTRSFGLDPDDPPVWTESLWIRRHERLPVVIESDERVRALA